MTGDDDENPMRSRSEHVRLPPSKTTENAPRVMLAHYAPDLDLDDEMDFVVKGQDGKYKYRPAQQTSGKPQRGPRRRARQSSRQQREVRDIGSMNDEEFDAYLAKARQG